MSVKVPAEWVPTAFMLAADNDMNTEIIFSPRQLLQQPDWTFVSEIRIYDPQTAKVCHRINSGPVPFDGCFHQSSEQFRDSLPKGHSLYYGEIFNRPLNEAPPNLNIALPSNIHYGSRSGRLHGEVGSAYIFGAPRRAYKGKHYFNHFPFGDSLSGLGFKLFMLNPYVRPSYYSVSLVSSTCPREVVTEGTIEGKCVGSCEAVMDVPGGEGAAIVVSSELKLNVFYCSIDWETKLMHGMDHGHPFLMDRLSH